MNGKNDNSSIVIFMIIITMLLIRIYKLYYDINAKEILLSNSIWNFESCEKNLYSCKEEKEVLESDINDWIFCDDYCKQ